MLLYVFLLLSAGTFESFFTEMLHYVDNLDSNLMVFIIFSDLTVFLLQKESTKKRQTFFTRLPILFWIPFFYIYFRYYTNIFAYAALIVGFFEIQGFLKFYTDVQNSRCNYLFERCAWKTQGLFYFYYPIPTSKSDFSTTDNKMMNSETDGSGFTDTEGGDIKKKHKYENINVEDFITRQN